MIVKFPGSPYELHQPFEPSGDQPEAIERLTEGLEDGLSFQTLLGVTGSGKTYTMAHVIARLGRPALVLAPNKTLGAGGSDRLLGGRRGTGSEDAAFPCGGGSRCRRHRGGGGHRRPEEEGR